MELEEKLQRAGHSCRSKVQNLPSQSQRENDPPGLKRNGKEQKGRSKGMRTSFSFLEEGFLHQKDSERNSLGNVSK